ncbi:MAG: type II secretion system protein N [Steroidobacteraceae bacterium]
MPRGAWIALLGAAAFAVIVLTRLPASWIVPHGASRACASLDGTVWSGACTGLTVQRTALGDLSWDLQPSRLLSGALAGHVLLMHGAVNVRADVTFGFNGGLTLRNLVADIPLEPALIPELPHQLRGTAHLDLALARLGHDRITELQGRIEAHDLVERSGRVTPLGSYALTFPGGSGEPTATLQDLGGPLAVQGTLRLTKSGYELEGLVAARPGAAPELVSNLQYLGSPDALGRRPFSMAGTF